MHQQKDWFQEAIKHQEESEYSQGLVAIAHYVKEYPENKRGKLLMAVMYRNLSYYTKVLQILEEIKPCADDPPKYCRLYYSEIGDTYKAMGNYEEAIKWYDKVIEIVPTETYGYIFKGACLALMGKYDMAKIEHLKATTMEGDPEEAFYNLALISRAEMKFEEAKVYCEKSLRIDPLDKSVIHCYEDILKAIEMEMFQQQKSKSRITRRNVS